MKRRGKVPLKPSPVGFTDEDDEVLGQPRSVKLHEEEDAVEEDNCVGYEPDEIGGEEDEMKRLRETKEYGDFSRKYERERREEYRKARVEEMVSEDDGTDDDGVQDVDSDDMGEDPGSGDGVEVPSTLPVSYEHVLQSRHEAIVSTITLDSAGSRFATASLDQTIKLWDFGSMDSRLESFRSVEPLGSFPILFAQFSSSGGKILVGGGAAFAKVLDRDGAEIASCPSGDRYLHDMAQTKGHTAPLAGTIWHPQQPSMFYTIAGDATLRMWDFGKGGGIPKHTKIIKIRSKQSPKVNPSCLASDSSGSKIIVGCVDSTVRVYDPRGFSPKVVEEASEICSPGSELTSLCLSSDDLLLLGRSTDDCLRLWDVRNLNQPLKCFSGLQNVLAQTTAVFSPDGATMVTGTSVRKNRGESASLVFFDRTSLEEVHRVQGTPEMGSIVAVTWCPPTNQVLYGASDGVTRVLYDPEKSQRGILSCIAKPAKRKRDDAVVNLGPGKIYTPNALPMFRDEETIHGGRPRSRKRPDEVARERDLSTRKPTPPSQVFTKPVGSTLASYMAHGRVQETWREEDPRDALLKMEEKAKAKPIFTGNALLDQPTILADKTAEEEEAEARQRLLKRLPAHARPGTASETRKPSD